MKFLLITALLLSAFSAFATHGPGCRGTLNGQKVVISYTIVWNDDTNDMGYMTDIFTVNPKTGYRENELSLGFAKGNYSYNHETDKGHLGFKNYKWLVLQRGNRLSGKKIKTLDVKYDNRTGKVTGRAKIYLPRNKKIPSGTMKVTCNLLD